MKNLNKLGIILFLAVAAVFSSCSSDSNGGGGNASSGTMTAKVNGTSLTSTKQLTTGTKVTSGSTTMLTLQGTNNSGKGYQLIVNGFTGVGTYEIGGASSVFVVGTYVEANASNPIDSQTWSAPYDDDSVRGQIEFTSVTDTKVIGTFSFTAKNSDDSSIKEITDGSFNVSVTSF